MNLILEMKWILQGPKKITILFFMYFGTHSNKIHTIYFVHVVVLLLLAKQQQLKIVNLYTISVCYAWALGF
jgi:hypothetical protein